MEIKKIRKKVETLKLKIRRKYMNATAKNRKSKINNLDFTIISNNCWGGFIYQSYNLQYNTPTIGLFFVAEDYIKFVKQLKKYLDLELKEVKPEDSKWYEQLKNNASFGKYPIGKIDDIEIQFLHYKSFEEAKKTWDRRKKRVNYNNILFKFSDMNFCSEENIREFQNIPLKNKICFITKKNKHLSNSYTFIVTNGKELTASCEPFGKSSKVDINKIINSLKSKK